MRIGIRVGFGKEVEIFLRALQIVGTESKRAVLDFGRIAPILTVHDGLHALLDESRLQIRVRSLLDEDSGGIARMRVGVLITLLGGLHELSHQIRIGRDGLGVGDDADGVGVARTP